ncbi:MAG: hypothetical protein K5987_03365, partial [Lachnospiraceae bacterium]|nr:hypothetical protein [Lachnospiraceae bacterium]
VSKKIKNSLFDNYAICEIKVQPSEGFEDGSVVYTIDGVNGEFPLTEKCQGRTVYVRLPKHAQLHIKAADEYSKMITVKVSE